MKNPWSIARTQHSPLSSGTKYRVLCQQPGSNTHSYHQVLKSPWSTATIQYSSLSTGIQSSYSTARIQHSPVECFYHMPGEPVMNLLIPDPSLLKAHCCIQICSPVLDLTGYVKTRFSVLLILLTFLQDPAMHCLIMILQVDKYRY